MKAFTFFLKFLLAFTFLFTNVVALVPPGSSYFALAARAMSAPAELRGRAYRILQAKFVPAGLAEIHRRASNDDFEEEERAIFETVAPLGRAERFYAVQKKREEERRRRRDVETVAVANGKRSSSAADDTLLSHSGPNGAAEEASPNSASSPAPAVLKPSPTVASVSSSSLVTHIPTPTTPTSTHEMSKIVKESLSSSKKLKENSKSGSTKVKVNGTDARQRKVRRKGVAGMEKKTTLNM
ncbi:hypothetical protein GYMLUDRAFT_39892, partial [Collybiopsis luxurians FD-317 M1]